MIARGVSPGEKAIARNEAPPGATQECGIHIISLILPPLAGLSSWLLP